MVAVTRYYHAEDQYLETFTELQHYLINSLVCIRTLQIMTYGYSHPLSSYSSVTRFQVKAHILRVRGQSVSHAANLTGDVLPQLPLVEPKSMVYYIQLCSALISLSNGSICYSPTASPTMDFVLRLQYPTSLPIKEQSRQGSNPSCTEI